MTKPYKCRVEYLESTGTQYIDTKYVMTSGRSSTFNGNIMWTQNVATANFFYGYRSVNSATLSGDMRTFFIYGASPAGRIAIRYGVNGDNSTSAISLNQKYNISWDGNNFKVNGTTFASLSSAYTPANYKNMWLFWCNCTNYYSDDVGHFVGRIYNWQIFDNGILARDFIPVLDNSGRPAMYDQMSGQLFYNQGTGEFTYGRQIIPVEYLESTGTQYIDTLVVLSSTDKVEALAEYTGKPSSGSSYVFGTFGSNKNFGINADLQNSGNFYGVWYNQGTVTASTPKPEFNTRYKVEVSSNGIYINNTLFSNVSGTFTGSNPAYLFWANGTSQPKSIMKLYSCQMWQSSTLVRDFIPCIDENLTPFMFDKVNCTVYLNAGTGQFKVGPNVEKSWGGKKLRRKLALALANLKKKRPYYCELEYLESTGTQYIDTGIIPTENTRTLAKLYTTETGNKNWFGSSAVAGAYGSYGFNAMSETSVEYIFGNSQWKVLSASNVVGNPFTLDFSKDGIIINGTSIGTPAYTSFGTGSLTMTLFLRNGGTAYISGRLYCFQIWNNDVLVRDFIPVLDWDYVPCLYDKVSGQFFYNQGSAQFLYGREIHYVDYLESDGTQYIDTGVYLTNNHSVSLDYQLTSASQSRKGLFGGLNSNVSSRYGTVLSPSNQNLEAGYGSGNNYYQFGLPDTSRHVMYQKKNELYFDGVLVNTFATATFTQAQTAFLCNFNFENYNPASAKYYSSKWWDGDKLILDFKPAIDENGVGFMFDRVSHTCFLNAGTGVFKYPAIETEYTANAATKAYIDLGVKYKPSMTIQGKYTRDTYGTQGSVILVTTTTSAPLIYLPALSGTSTERFVWRRGGYTEQSYFISNIQYPFTAEIKIDAVNDTLTINNEIVKTGMIAGMNGYDSPYESDSNMYMFSITSTYAGDGKVYYLKITDGTTPLFDLIPAYKDGEAGFYNKVNGTFYKNASTDSTAKLTGGKIIEPEYE